jgi:hypothetical protein
MAEDRKPGEILPGDIVAVTAKVICLRTDGSYGIEPVGFDYDVVGNGVDFYTVDPPALLEGAFRPGDQVCWQEGELRGYFHTLLPGGLAVVQTRTGTTGAYDPEADPDCFTVAGAGDMKHTHWKAG